MNARTKLFFSVRFRLVLLCAALLLALVGSNAWQRHLLLQARALDREQAEQVERLQRLQTLQDSIVELRTTTSRSLDPGAALPAGAADPASAMVEIQRQIRSIDAQDAVLAQALRTLLQGVPERLEDAGRLGGAAGVEVDPSTRRWLAALRRDLLESERLLVAARAAENAGLQSVRARLDAAQDASIRAANLITVLVTAAGLAMLALILRQVVWPLQRTMRALRQLESGRADVDLPPVSADEFGEMALALRQIREQAQQLDRLAFHDTLTALPNRARLEHALPPLLEEARAKALPLALLFLDLDHFKSVNDAVGHARGDRCIALAAERLRTAVPPGGTLFRYGGDAFVIVMPQPLSDAQLPARLRQTAEQVLAVMSAPCRIDAHTLAMSASIGVAVFPDDATSAADLVGSAAAAMYQAKNAGRHQVQFATRDPTSHVRQRTLLAGDVRRGLDADEFEVFFQPIVDVAAGRVEGAEVLMRWDHPGRGLVMPGEFVPAAEASGAITPLGLRGLDRGCAQLARFGAAGRDFRLAVNLSSRQLYNASFVRCVGDALQRYGVPAERLEFEITESTIMEQPEQSMRLLGELRALGVGLCVDDFGTGCSSLSYLQRFPITKIKIDRSFVGRLLQSREVEAIVVATLSMARSLRLDVVAEGVETVAQMQRLHHIGCDRQQGFLFSPALAAAEFEYWLDTAPKSFWAAAPSAGLTA